MRTCWVHSRRHLYTGFFYPDQVGRKVAGARLTIGQEEYETTLSLHRIHRSQPRKDLEGRYFAISERRGVVHLCTCPGLTKKELETARQEASRMMEKFEAIRNRP